MRHEPIASKFEFWPPVLFYIPVVIRYFQLALKHRGLMLPTISNPAIYSGGMILESKSKILSLVSDSQSRWIAPWFRLRSPGPNASPSRILKDPLDEMNRLGLTFPVVAKPDIGQRGDGVRPLWNEANLTDYLTAFPPHTDYLIQKLIPYPVDAGIFYYRYPGENRGRIFSITLKHFPKVTGDGRRTVKELILADRRARLIKHIYFARHRRRLHEVLPEGETLQLVFAGNHAKGAVFTNGARYITPALTRALHRVAVSMPGFYFGRFDVRFPTLADLAAGENFYIMEINGASSEATHIWDARTRLIDAYRTLFTQFDILFKIGRANRRNGYKPIRPIQLLRDAATYRKAGRKYPPTA